MKIEIKFLALVLFFTNNLYNMAPYSKCYRDLIHLVESEDSDCLDTLNRLEPPYLAVIDGRLLYKAALYSKPQTVRWLAQHGADVNWQCGYLKDTALHRAVINGNILMVKTLLDCDAKLDIKNSKNQSPIDLAKDYQDNEPDYNKSQIAKIIILRAHIEE